MRQVALAVSIVVGGMVALFGFLLLVSVRMSAEWGPTLATVGCAALLLGWLLFPVMGFGSDETLDPLRLALFPIPKRRLMAGLLGAGFVGVPALATVVAVSGAVIGYGAGPGLPLALAIAAALLLVCVAGSRAVVTLLAPALRSRRGRDVVLVASTVLGAAVYTAQLLLPRSGSDPDALLRRLRGAAGVLRRTPFGWAGDAFVATGDGRYGTALLELAGLLAFGALLVWVWAAALDRAMTAVDDAAPDAGAGAAGELAPRALRGLLPGGRAGAVAARELRYLAREPRRRAQTVGAVVFASVLPLVAMRGMSARPYGLLYPGLILGLSAANQLGLDGPAWWLHVATGQAGRADLLGKNLATTVFALPVLALGAGSALAFGAERGATAALFCAAVGAYGISLGFANVASVRAPYAVPESTSNPWATGGTSGCATAVYGIVTMVGTAILLLPSVLLIALGDGPAYLVAGAFAALAMGGAAWWGGLVLAGNDLDRRGPEVLAAIDPRRA
jgi:ABC-2 type transport system permease protein